MTQQNFENLFESLMNEELPMVHKTGGNFSFGLVNSCSNGKRITLSKALSAQLKLEDSICIMPSVEKRQLVIGKALPFPKAMKINLRGSGKKIGYSASCVEVITKAFALDFSNRVCTTFYNIDFGEKDGAPFAVINVP